MSLTDSPISSDSEDKFHDQIFVYKNVNAIGEYYYVVETQGAMLPANKRIAVYNLKTAGKVKKVLDTNKEHIELS